jgi:hypothetical protein
MTKFYLLNHIVDYPVLVATALHAGSEIAPKREVRPDDAGHQQT